MSQIKDLRNLCETLEKESKSDPRFLSPKDVLHNALDTADKSVLNHPLYKKPGSKYDAINKQIVNSVLTRKQTAEKPSGKKLEPDNFKSQIPPSDVEEVDEGILDRIKAWKNSKHVKNNLDTPLMGTQNKGMPDYHDEKAYPVSNTTLRSKIAATAPMTLQDFNKVNGGKEANPTSEYGKLNNLIKTNIAGRVSKEQRDKSDAEFNKKNNAFSAAPITQFHPSTKGGSTASGFESQIPPEDIGDSPTVKGLQLSLQGYALKNLAKGNPIRLNHDPYMSDDDLDKEAEETKKQGRISLNKAGKQINQPNTYFPNKLDPERIKMMLPGFLENKKFESLKFKINELNNLNEGWRELAGTLKNRFKTNTNVVSAKPLTPPIGSEDFELPEPDLYSHKNLQKSTVSKPYISKPGGGEIAKELGLTTLDPYRQNRSSLQKQFISKGVMMPYSDEEEGSDATTAAKVNKSAAVFQKATPVDRNVATNKEIGTPTPIQKINTHSPESLAATQQVAINKSFSGTKTPNALLHAVVPPAFDDHDATTQQNLSLANTNLQVKKPDSYNISGNAAAIKYPINKLLKNHNLLKKI